MSNLSPKAVVEVTAAELQGPGVVFCPNPKMPQWSAHPRVQAQSWRKGLPRALKPERHPASRVGQPLHMAGL
jgi:hypothetical protein